MDRADGALNATYGMVKRRLSGERRVQLVRSERAWIDKRRQTCLAAGAPGVLPSPEIARMLCLVDQTDRRTTYLSSFH